MKDINGTEIPAKPMLDAQGQPVNHKPSLFGKIFAGVKHGVEAAGENVKHVAEAPFHKHEVAPAAPAEPAKEATPAEAPEVKAEPEAK